MDWDQETNAFSYPVKSINKSDPQRLPLPDLQMPDQQRLAVRVQGVQIGDFEAVVFDVG